MGDIFHWRAVDHEMEASFLAYYSVETIDVDDVSIKSEVIYAG